VRTHILIALWCVAGCGSVDGTLKVDGAPVALARCHNLARIGLSGVDLDLEDGRTVRLFREGDDLVEVGFFSDPASDLGVSLGPCVEGEATETNVRSGDIFHVRGEATLACEDPVTLEGSLAFGGCR